MSKDYKNMIKCAESVKKDRANGLERPDFLLIYTDPRRGTLARIGSPALEQTIDKSSVELTDRWKAHGQQELASGSVAASSHCRLITPPPSRS